jgi:hypothetical protein
LLLPLPYVKMTTAQIERQDIVKYGRMLKAVLTGFRNVLLGGNLMSLLLVTRPKALIYYITQNLFLFKSITNRRKLPQKNVFEVLPGSDNVQSIRLGNLRSSTWFSASSSPASDIASLCLICQIVKPASVFEIGTLDGYAALHFALNTREHARIHTLDLPKSNRIAPALETTVIDDNFIGISRSMGRLCFEGEETSPKVSCLFGDSATFDFSPFHGKIDFFFIDGSHSYEYVRSDTLNALKCCHPGSVIAWHDYGQMGMSGVDKYLHELVREGRAIYSVPGGSVAFMVVPDTGG